MFESNEFNAFRKQVTRQFGWLAVVALFVNLAFWLGLAARLFALARHFGVI